MLNKKAQFYLVSIIVIIAIFMGFATIINYGQRIQTFNLDDLYQELKIEKRYLLDYISENQLTDLETENIFINFSNNYVEKIGTDKDIFFIFGKQGGIKVVGNKLDETNVSVDEGLGYSDFTEEGEFEQNYSPTSEFKIKIEENEYIFKLREGQNFYYLVHHLDNEERHIING